MIRAKDIRPFRTSSPDYAATEVLKAEFRVRRGERRSFFLTASELDRIFRWKLRGQYGRTQVYRAKNTDAAYRAITQAALNIVDRDFDREATARMALLTSLHGVGVPVASAVLALVDPDRHCVIDFRGWRSVFGEERRAFLVPHYLRYRAAVSEIGAHLLAPTLPVSDLLTFAVSGDAWDPLPHA